MWRKLKQSRVRYGSGGSPVSNLARTLVTSAGNPDSPGPKLPRIGELAWSARGADSICLVTV